MSHPTAEQIAAELTGRHGLYRMVHKGWPWPWLTDDLRRALAERAGPASDYLSPPQQSHARREFLAATVTTCTWPTREREFWEDRPDLDMGPGGGRLRPGS